MTVKQDRDMSDLVVIGAIIALFLDHWDAAIVLFIIWMLMG